MNFERGLFASLGLEGQAVFLKQIGVHSMEEKSLYGLITMKPALKLPKKFAMNSKKSAPLRFAWLKDLSFLPNFLRSGISQTRFLNELIILLYHSS